MRFGLNLLLWCDTLEDSVLPVLEDIKKIGYDAVEVPIFEHDVEKYALWGKRLNDLGLGADGRDDPPAGQQSDQPRRGRAMCGR